MPILFTLTSYRYSETMITTWLRHQIIKLEDIRVSTTSGTLYVVMELMECDLQRILASGQVLTVEHVKVILKQLLLGVQAMHHHGILRERAPLYFYLSASLQVCVHPCAICAVEFLPTEVGEEAR